MDKFKYRDTELIEIPNITKINLYDKETDAKVGIGSYCRYFFCTPFSLYSSCDSNVSISGDLSLDHSGELVLEDKIYRLEILSLSQGEPASLSLLVDIILDEMFPSSVSGEITTATYSFRDARNTTKEEYIKNFKKHEEEIKQQEKE